MTRYPHKYTKIRFKLSAAEQSGMSDLLTNLDKLRLTVTDRPRVAQGATGEDATTTKPIAG